VSVANATLLVLVPLLLRLTSGARLEDLGLRRGGWGRDVRVGVVASLLIAPLVYALNLVASLVWSRSTHPLEEMIRVQFTGRTAYLAVLSAVLLAPAAEELIFRGVIQGWLTRLFTTPAEADPKPDDLSGLLESIDLGGLSAPAGRRPWLLPRMPRPLREASRRRASSGVMPVVLTSALFALLHAEQWPAPLAIFFLSLGLGTVYQRSGSLLTSFTIHALFNGFSTLLLFTALLAGDAVGKNLKPVSGYLTGHGSIASGSGAGPVSKNLDSIIVFLLSRAPGTDTVPWVPSSFKTSRPSGQGRVPPEVRINNPSPRGRDFQDMRVNIRARDGR
jgi:membrane protease YdiL (CAAX protease family)